MLLAFQTYVPKYPNKAFLVPNLLFFLFWTIFCISANSKMLISNITIVFQIYRAKYPNKAFLDPFFIVAVIAVAVLLEFWYLDKLESADFKYGNNFSNLQPKITQIYIFGSRFENCLFCINYCLMTYSKVLTSNVTIVLENSSLQITQKHFCPRFNVFLFLHKNLFWQIWGCWQQSFSLSKFKP